MRAIVATQGAVTGGRGPIAYSGIAGLTASSWRTRRRPAIGASAASEEFARAGGLSAFPRPARSIRMECRYNPRRSLQLNAAMLQESREGNTSPVLLTVSPLLAASGHTASKSHPAKGFGAL